MTNTSLSFVISNTAIGAIERRFFSAITGVLPSDLLNNAKFINNTPDIVDYPNNIDQNADIGDNYGQQFRGYFIAPRTGTNIFYVSSDDASELYLSSDENPANKVSIAKEEQWNNGRDWLQTARRTVNPATGFLFNRSGTNLNGANAVITAITVAGKKYYIEFDHKEGTGGDRATVYVVLPGDALPAAGAVPNIGPFLSPFTAPAAIALTREPTNTIALENATATFVAAATGVPSAQFKWQRNGVDIAGATSASYTTPILTPGDNGAQYRAIAYNTFSSATTSNATLTVVTDTTAPTLVSALSSPTLTNVTVVFSERVTIASAQNLANYSIAGLTIISATLQADNVTVVLRTGAQTEGQSYTLQVSGIQDRAAAPNTIVPTSSPFGLAYAGGLVKVELFTGISGNAVANLTAAPSYIANAPNAVFYTNTFAFGAPLFNSFLTMANSGLDNYGTRISGWFIAPSNGNFRFYIRSDDLSQLSMNTNNAGDTTEPRGAVVIAQQSTACCKPYGDSSGGPNTSGNITLIGGRKYYMEALRRILDGLARGRRDASPAQ